MTIFQSKSNQQGDSDDPPPKKKLKKSKNLITKSKFESHGSTHTLNNPTTSSAPGPSNNHHNNDLFYLAGSYEPKPPQFEDDRVVEKFILKLDKFDVGIVPRNSGPPAAWIPYPDFNEAGPSHVKNQIYNPNCLEYYIYGPGSSAANSKAAPRPPKRPYPFNDEDNDEEIEVISSEDIVVNPVPAEPASTSDAGSLLDDINNFDFDDKFGEIEKFQQDAIWEDSTIHTTETTNQVASMLEPRMNGLDRNSSSQGSLGIRNTRSSPAASLSNLGNTCFLNSVLYTLRFAPNFLYNLHHLVDDMNAHASSFDLTAKKTASLGRNLRLMSTNKKKDKVVFSGAGDLAPTTMKTKKQIVTEKLHEVYEAMRVAETKDNPEPLQPDVFLTALREVNPIFEGNQQQDAHELLVCLLDIFRETCQAYARQAETRAAFEANALKNSPSLAVAGGDKTYHKKTWLPKTVSKTALELKNKMNTALNASTAPRVTLESSIVNQEPVLNLSRSTALDHVQLNNFVAQDFEGVMVLRTTCLECENTTEKNEPFADICVPINNTEENEDDRPTEQRNDEVSRDRKASELYQRAVVTDEFLRDRNKYYCEECQRYNEARRSVSYRRLPRLLTLQLKRFSSTFGAMSKVTNYMPTPMTLSCFCEECMGKDSGHKYDLYGVIMHLGSNMAGGHYIAYVRVTDSAATYRNCPRDLCQVVAPKPVKTMLSFWKPGGPTKAPPNDLPPPKTVCRASDCCAVRIPEPCGKYEPSSPWMTCDDDIVKLLTADDVKSLLSENSTSIATPYLLFYARRAD